MRAVFNSNQFKKEMNNIVNYSVGFLEGVQKGKTVFLKTHQSKRWTQRKTQQ